MFETLKSKLTDFLKKKPLLLDQELQGLGQKTVSAERLKREREIKYEARKIILPLLDVIAENYQNAEGHAKISTSLNNEKFIMAMKDSDWNEFEFSRDGFIYIFQVVGPVWHDKKYTRFSHLTFEVSNKGTVQVRCDTRGAVDKTTAVYNLFDSKVSMHLEKDIYYLLNDNFFLEGILGRRLRP